MNSSTPVKIHTPFDPEAVVRRAVGKLVGMGHVTPPVIVELCGDGETSVCAALCAKAFGADKVYGVILPNITDTFYGKSVEVAERIGIKWYNVPVAASVADLYHQMQHADIEVTEKALWALPYGIKGVALRGVAMSLGAAIVNDAILEEFHYADLSPAEREQILCTLNLADLLPQADDMKGK